MDMDFENRIVAPEFLSVDSDIEVSLRPKTLDDYIGQEKVKENLRVYIEAAKKEGTPLTTFCFTALPVSVKQLSQAL